MRDYVLDVTFAETATLTFCPIENDGTVVVGLAIMADKCPGRFVGVFHSGGQAAVEEWCDSHKDIIDRLVSERAR